MSRTTSALWLGLAVFSFYLATMSGSLPGYRDAGEMAASAYTLGVSHPPSYPLYILSGHVFQAIGLGTPAWRLTLLSAAAGAGAVATLFWTLAPLCGTAAALAAAVFFALNAAFHAVAIVPEMYTLTLLFAASLLALALRLRERFEPNLWAAFAFLYGLFLGNRTDLVLLAPGLLFIAASGSGFSEQSVFKRFRSAFAWGVLGLSIYLYLPIRSSQGPWLDWNHPSTLHNFIGSLTRRGYGGTLDLLSKSYAPGSQFWINMKIYAGHLFYDYLGWALPVVFLGAFAMRKQKVECAGLGAAYLLSGPVFLWLANMPPNPHALAIVEPHYLLSDLILVVLAAWGISAMIAAAGQWALVPLAAALLLPYAPWTRPPAERVSRWQRVNHRWNLVNYDHSRDVMRSAPENASVIAKKDVQLFSLWYYQTVEGVRPDLGLIAQGLSGSAWYQDSARRRGSRLIVPVRDLEGFQRFSAVNGPDVFVTNDAELPEGFATVPWGLIYRVGTGAMDASILPFLVRRGDFRVSAQPDFFQQDLVNDYATSRERIGSAVASQSGNWLDGLPHFKAAWAMKWLMPESPVLIGFALFRAGRLAEAASSYEWADRLYGRTLELTREYHSLPDLATSIKRAAAEANLNHGVVLEKMNRREDAEKRYRAAMLLKPDYAQPHYNLAVLHWNKDWKKVVAELETVLILDPNHGEAKKFLPLARAKLR